MRPTRGAWLITLATLAAAGGAHDDVGFVSLFDGKTLRGWTSVGTDRFSARGGVLVQDGGTGWLRSAKVYRDFEFRAEFRVVRPGSDTGVFFRSTPEGTDAAPHWPREGYQLQVIDADSHFMVFGHGLTAKFDRDADALKAARKGPGEWQSLTLKVAGGRAEATLNGRRVTVAEGLARREGSLGLQGENGHVEWRALSVKELPGR